MSASLVAVGNARVRRVRDREQALLGLGLERRELGLAFLDLASTSAFISSRAAANSGDFLSSFAISLVRAVALLAQRVELALELAAALVEALPRAHDRGNIASAAKDIVHSGWVEHGLPQ